MPVLRFLLGVGVVFHFLGQYRHVLQKRIGRPLEAKRFEDDGLSLVIGVGHHIAGMGIQPLAVHRDITAVVGHKALRGLAGRGDSAFQ